MRKFLILSLINSVLLGGRRPYIKVREGETSSYTLNIFPNIIKDKGIFEIIIPEKQKVNLSVMEYILQF